MTSQHPRRQQIYRRRRVIGLAAAVVGLVVAALLVLTMMPSAAPTFTPAATSAPPPAPTASAAFLGHPERLGHPGHLGHPEGARDGPGRGHRGVHRRHTDLRPEPPHRQRVRRARRLRQGLRLMLTRALMIVLDGRSC